MHIAQRATESIDEYEYDTNHLFLTSHPISYGRVYTDMLGQQHQNTKLGNTF